MYRPRANLYNLNSDFATYLDLSTKLKLRLTRASKTAWSVKAFHQ